MKRIVLISSLLLICFAAFAQTPKAEIRMPKSIWCANEEVRFNNGSTDADSFIWRFGNGEVSYDRKPRYLYGSTVNRIDSYTVWLIAINKFNLRKDSVSKIIQVQEAAIAEYSFKAVSIVLFLYPECQNYVGLQWDYGDGNTDIRDADSITHVYNSGGTYTVELIANTEFGCNDTFSQDIVIVDSTSGNNFVEYNPYSLSLSPNPSKNAQFLNINLNEPTSLKIGLFDLNGKQVHQLERQFGAGSQQLNIGEFLRNEPRGTYLINVQDDRHSYLLKATKL